MDNPLRLPAARRPRRSHAERTAETKARIRAAVVESIGELGFSRTTATEIARRAGVSWGAVQHHFGDKQGILVAVLEDSFNRFAERLGDVAIAETSLDERVASFVERAWEHFGSAHYRCTFEILQSFSGPDEASPAMPWQAPTLEAWNRIWDGFFGDAPLTPRRRLAVQYYAVSVLSGLASLRILEGATPAMRELELGFLRETLVRELRPDGNAAPQ